MASICGNRSHSGTKTCWTCKGTGAPASLSRRGVKGATCTSCNGKGVVCKACDRPKS